MKDLEGKLKQIEREIQELKLMSLRYTKPKKRVSLKGLLKGVKIEDKHVEEAKKSLFKYGD